MNIIANETYHIYNQGNNRERIFHEDADYIEFLKLFRKYVLPNCETLAYCLMPNHFHFLIQATELSAKNKLVGNLNLCELSNGYRLLQSNYAQYINKKKGRTGSLFRQKTKAKSLQEGHKNYGFIAFHYIHQNPLRAGLVQQLEDWGFSSFPDYAGRRNGTICNRELAFALIGLDKENFINEAGKHIDGNKIKKIF
jgi:REP element-mobilizing transposase RayT